MQKQDFTAITTGIARVIETEEGVLNSLSVEAITLRRNSQNRTIKQILGHLIDSASNNHQRMVRLQYSKDLLFFPDYRQDNDLWIALQDYQHRIDILQPKELVRKMYEFFLNNHTLQENSSHYEWLHLNKAIDILSSKLLTQLVQPFQ